MTNKTKQTEKPGFVTVTFQVSPLAVTLFQGLGAVDQRTSKPAPIEVVAKQVFLDFLRGNAKME
jgi:hypothetical protein